MPGDRDAVTLARNADAIRDAPSFEDIKTAERVVAWLNNNATDHHLTRSMESAESHLRRLRFQKWLVDTLEPALSNDDQLAADGGVDLDYLPGFQATVTEEDRPRPAHVNLVGPYFELHPTAPEDAEVSAAALIEEVAGDTVPLALRVEVNEAPNDFYAAILANLPAEEARRTGEALLEAVRYIEERDAA